MKQVSGKALIKIAADHGWVVDRIKGSHHILLKEGESSILTIPVHSNQPLKIGLLKALMKQAGLTEGDL
ncbi:MAG: type II toxin-antitoxin system HicA family toxin [Verrucomicrobiaceae bacterium]|nr:type II toxin-antitoxin system HicA family toxin [Verrucomicrobiaceae bacterium]